MSTEDNVIAAEHLMIEVVNKVVTVAQATQWSIPKIAEIGVTAIASAIASITENTEDDLSDDDLRDVLVEQIGVLAIIVPLLASKTDPELNFASRYVSVALYHDQNNTPAEEFDRVGVNVLLWLLNAHYAQLCALFVLGSFSEERARTSIDLIGQDLADLAAKCGTRLDHVAAKEWNDQCKLVQMFK